MKSQATVAGALSLLLWAGGAAQAQESPYLYGIHDHDPAPHDFLNRVKAQGASAWVTATVAIGSDPAQTGGDDFRWISSQGHAVIVRLNNGYCPQGTIPTPDRYDAFAQRAANYVAATQGASLFVIGNETNLAGEWPAASGHASYVSPEDYATLFRKVYAAIKAVRPDAKVISQALAPFAGPYSAGSTCGFTHDAQPLNWVQYLNRMLNAIRATGGIDGIALHINSRGYRYEDIHSTERVSAGGQSLSFSFDVYRDWVELGIPPQLYHLPLYATEANGIYFWKGGHPERPDSHYEPGWVQEVYAEIDRYNQEAAAAGKPVYRAVNLYRWCGWCDGWNIDGSPYEGQILADLDQAVAHGYRWPSGGAPPPPPPPPSGTNLARQAIAWAASSSYSSAFGGDKAHDGVVSGSSKWTSNGVAAESWLALDLGSDADLTGFVVRHAGAASEPASFNTSAFRLETGGSLQGPWTSHATVQNTSQAPVSTVTLPTAVRARFVRLYVTDAGIDNHARIPELEAYGTAVAPPPPTPGPSGTNLARQAVAWAASSVYSSSFGGDQAHDGVVSASSKWTSDGVAVESWLALDLGADADLSSFVVRHAGAAAEPAYFNTAAFRIETGGSLQGPWTSQAAVSNGSQAPVSTVTLAAPVRARFVRLYVTNAGIDRHARIPELEAWGALVPPPDPYPTNLIQNGDFAGGLAGWSSWTERGSLGATVANGQLQIASANHNGGLYQQFATGGAGSALEVAGFWASGPTVAQSQWAEVLVINGPRLPVNGQDVNASQADVVLAYKNDTWSSPGGWSGAMELTSPVASTPRFTAADDVATIVLKSGNLGGLPTGTRFDDVRVTRTDSAPPPPPPPAPEPLPDYCPSGALDFAAIRADLESQGQDLAFVKIGFHVGPGGNAQGLGEWMRCLDAAGVPFFLKSADSAGQIYEAVQLKAASAVPHVLVYRKSVGSGWNPDVPDYGKTPHDAAVEHWQRHRAAFPPELEPYKHLLWVETINEVDKNRAEWLAEFSVHTIALARAEGFNYAAFGWSSGEPEPEHWQGPWMRELLALAAAEPDRVAIALHEYSFTTDNLTDGHPFLVGRFQKLYEIADGFGHRRPTVLVTEFGWGYQDVPSVQQAMSVDVPWAAALYAPHPELLGAAIWYLGPGFGGIANQAQQLIAPITEYALRNYFAIPKP